MAKLKDEHGMGDLSQAIYHEQCNARESRLFNFWGGGPMAFT
ncbi:hypothetical protein [Granulosicoccus antarcticus]|nr:hypothetical protein [Granulosicoccus antarcticus]